MTTLPDRLADLLTEALEGLRSLDRRDPDYPIKLGNARGCIAYVRDTYVAITAHAATIVLPAAAANERHAELEVRTSELDPFIGVDPSDAQTLEAWNDPWGQDLAA